MKFGRRMLVPADHGVPADLPRWARDELVARRLEVDDLKRENLNLRVELARARGDDISAVARGVKRDIDAKRP